MYSAMHFIYNVIITVTSNIDLNIINNSIEETETWKECFNLQCKKPAKSTLDIFKN